MKIEVYRKRENEKQKVILKLFGPDAEGDVSLSIVNDEGKWLANIAHISTSGSMTLCKGVPKEFGLLLDKEGRIVIEKILSSDFYYVMDEFGRVNAHRVKKKEHAKFFSGFPEDISIERP